MPLLPFVAFLPLLRWLDDASTRSTSSRLWGGILFGTVGFAIAAHFFLAVVRISWLAIPLYVGFVLLIALRVGLTVTWIGWLRRRTGLGYGILLPATWIPVEWLQTFGDLRMSGDHVGLTVAQYPFLIQIADTVGPYGVGAFALAVNGLIYDGFLAARDGDFRRPRMALGLLLVVVLSYDAWCWVRPLPEGESLRVAIVQPNIPIDEKHDEATSTRQFETLARLSRQARQDGASWIVWPESARPGPVYHWLQHDSTYRADDVAALARELDVTILFGAEYVRVRTREDYDLFNAAMAVDPSGGLQPSWYGKRYLVPFAERTPFRSLLGRFVDGKEGEWKWLAGGFEPGPDLAPVDVHGVRAGVVVCFEQLFPTLSRRMKQDGAEFGVVITNDAWWGRTRFQQHQADALRMRAVETRSDFVRAANTGISGFYDARGRMYQATDTYVEGVEVRDIRRSARPTTYSRTGDWIVAILVAGLIGAWLQAFRSTRIRPKSFAR